MFTDDRKDRFGDLLEVILNDKSLVPDNQDLGASKEDLDSHSNRKGAASYLCGLSVNLSAVNIFLRAGWSVGAVQDRYIFSGPGGDQIVGRANAGLDPNSRNFAVLPASLYQSRRRKNAKNWVCPSCRGVGSNPWWVSEGSSETDCLNSVSREVAEGKFRSCQKCG